MKRKRMYEKPFSEVFSAIPAELMAGSGITGTGDDMEHGGSFGNKSGGSGITAGGTGFESGGSFGNSKRVSPWEDKRWE